MKERLIEMVSELEEVVTDLSRAEEEADGMYAESGGGMPEYPYKYGVLSALLKSYAKSLDTKIKYMKLIIKNHNNDNE